MCKHSLKTFLIFVLFLAIGATAQSAFVFQTNTVHLSEGETLSNERLYIAKKVQLEGKVENDVFIMAGSGSLFERESESGAIFLSGIFKNDVWALGNTIDLTGRIEDHARLIAKVITVDGIISNFCCLLATTIHLTPNSKLNGGGWLFGENLIAEGKAGGDMNFIGKSVTLSGTFVSNVYLAAGDIVILPGTRIMGDLRYRSSSELVLDRKVIIDGNLVRETPLETEKTALPFLHKDFLSQCLFFLGALLSGIVLVALFPAFTQETVRRLRYSFWPSLFSGMITILLLPVAVFLTFISIIGIPLGTLIILSFIILTYSSKIIIALMIGKWLIRRPGAESVRSFFFPLAAGLLLLYLAVNIGIIGHLIAFLVTFAGTGAILLTLFGHKRVLPSHD